MVTVCGYHGNSVWLPHGNSVWLPHGNSVGLPWLLVTVYSEEKLGRKARGGFGTK